MNTHLNSPTRSYSKRDIANFVRVRIAGPGDDQALGQFIVNVFAETYEKKLPQVQTSADRRSELLDTASRRRDGIVLVIELGFRIIGTVSLIHPEAKGTQSWKTQSANLRCLAIDPNFHGLHLSELLLDEAENLARAWNCEHICLHVQEGADKVAQLYIQRGYQREQNGDFFLHGNELQAYCLLLNQTMITKKVC